MFRLVFLAVSKTFSKLFGVATVTFFGRMPSRDDDRVAAVGLLSLWWVLLPPAVAFPRFAEYVIPFLPDDEAAVRLIAVALALVVPLIIGWLITGIHNRRREGHRVARIFGGYVYAPVIGALVLALAVVIPITKGSHLIKRFELRHLALMTRRGDFEDMLSEVRQALDGAGITTERTPPPRVLWWVFRALTRVEERIFRRALSLRMEVLRATCRGKELDGLDGHDLEVMLHATDLSIIGPKKAVAYAHAVLAEELGMANVYYTWDDHAQELEDEILQRRERIARGQPVPYDEVLQLRDRLRHLELDEDEWNAVRRRLYELERDCFRETSAAQGADGDEGARMIRLDPAQAGR